MKTYIHTSARTHKFVPYYLNWAFHKSRFSYLSLNDHFGHLTTKDDYELLIIVTITSLISLFYQFSFVVIRLATYDKLWSLVHTYQRCAPKHCTHNQRCALHIHHAIDNVHSLVAWSSHHLLTIPYCWFSK